MGQEPEHRELRLLLQVFVGGWYIAIADVGGLHPLRVTCWASLNSAQLQVLRQAQGERFAIRGRQGGMIKTMRPGYSPGLCSKGLAMDKREQGGGAGEHAGEAAV